MGIIDGTGLVPFDVMNNQYKWYRCMRLDKTSPTSYQLQLEDVSSLAW